MSEREDELRRIAALAAADVLATVSETARTLAETAAHASQALISTIQVDLTHIKDDVKEIKACIDTKYVRVESFEPIRRVVYGLVALMLTGVVAALLALVLK